MSDFAPVLVSLGHLALAILIIILAKFGRDVLSPYNTQRELTEHDNPAFGLAIAGYYAAVVVICVSVLRPLPAGDEGAPTLLLGYGADLLWALIGVGALSLSRWLLHLFLLDGSSWADGIVGGKNIAAGAVECGMSISSGFVLAGVLRQPNGTPVTVLVFFLLSQLAFVLMARIYGRLAGYGMASEIRSGNIAAGVALGCTLVALSLLILKATSGEFVDWGTNLSYFAFDAIVGFALLLVMRWLTDLALLPNARIAEEIARDRNCNAGLIEGVVAIGVAALILFVF